MITTIRLNNGTHRRGRVDDPVWLVYQNGSLLGGHVPEVFDFVQVKRSAQLCPKIITLYKVTGPLI